METKALKSSNASLSERVGQMQHYEDILEDLFKKGIINEEGVVLDEKASLIL
jgi:hypothetical protein